MRRCDVEGNVDHGLATARDLADRLSTAAPTVVELWEHLPAQTRDAAIVMAYIVSRVEAGGPTWRLGFPDVEDHNAIENILEAVGLVGTYTGHREVRRWKRP